MLPAKSAEHRSDSYSHLTAPSCCTTCKLEAIYMLAQLYPKQNAPEETVLNKTIP